MGFTVWNDSISGAREYWSFNRLRSADRLKNGRRGGLQTLGDDAQLLLQPAKLLHADVVAAAHHHHHRAQVLGRRQLAFSLQPPDDAAVDGGQGGTAGGLHQHLLVVCGGEEMTRDQLKLSMF